MATITLYTFEDADGTEDTFTTYDATVARERGEKYDMKVIANEYEWSDSEVVWDFTSNATETTETTEGIEVSAAAYNAAPFPVNCTGTPDDEDCHDDPANPCRACFLWDDTAGRSQYWTNSTE